MPSNNGSKHHDSKRTGKTIREYVIDRFQNFDPAKHQVIVNNVPVDAAALETPCGIIDIVKIIPK